MPQSIITEQAPCLHSPLKSTLFSSSSFKDLKPRYSGIFRWQTWVLHEALLRKTPPSSPTPPFHHARLLAQPQTVLRFPHTRVLPELPRTCSLSTLPRWVQPFSSVHVCGAKKPSLGKQERKKKTAQQGFALPAFPGFQTAPCNHKNADTAAERSQEILFPPRPDPRESGGIP